MQEDGTIIKVCDEMKNTNFLNSKWSMKIGFLFLLLNFSLVCKADTIDVWNVSYNHRVPLHFNGYSNGEIVVNIDSIKPGDSITVRYYRDTPCHDCVTFLHVENEKHFVFFSSSQRGTGTPISFSVEQLLAIRNEGYIRPFLVFYSEGKLERRSDKIRLFRIRFE
ncbi:MAG: hypothetical protein RL632_2019 [Bacteroidota bacterium]